MGNKRDHTTVMDLPTSPYGDFIMDDREMLFHSIAGQVSSFHDDDGNVYCAVPVFGHSDADLARDPLSTNRRLVSAEELQVFGTMVVAGATSDHIKVLIPDTFSSPILNANSPVVLQHVVGLSLGTAADLSSSVPADNLDHLLCRNSVRPTLKKKQYSYWAEIHPILEKWRGVNGSTCPVCQGFVKYVASSTALTYDLSVFLALPCSELPGVVCFSIPGKGSFGGDTWFFRGTWLVISRVFASVWPGVVRSPVFL